jgi:acetyl esterase/lipase
MSLSGVPDVTAVNVFPNDAELRRAASPIFHVRSGLPPFLITYCQWDYDTLPAQAVAFDKALREAGTKAQLAFIPGENHISEIASVAKPADPTAVAILQFMQGLQ